jgi:hypothetical protein
MVLGRLAQCLVVVFVLVGICLSERGEGRIGGLAATKVGRDRDAIPAARVGAGQSVAAGSPLVGE